MQLVLSRTVQTNRRSFSDKNRTFYLSSIGIASGISRGGITQYRKSRGGCNHTVAGGHRRLRDVIYQRNHVLRGWWKKRRQPGPRQGTWWRALDSVARIRYTLADRVVAVDPLIIRVSVSSKIDYFHIARSQGRACVGAWILR